LPSYDWIGLAEDRTPFLAFVKLVVKLWITLKWIFKEDCTKEYIYFFA